MKKQATKPLHNVLFCLVCSSLCLQVENRLEQGLCRGTRSNTPEIPSFLSLSCLVEPSFPLRNNQPLSHPDKAIVLHRAQSLAVSSHTSSASSSARVPTDTHQEVWAGGLSHIKQQTPRLRSPEVPGLWLTGCTGFAQAPWWTQQDLVRITLTQGCREHPAWGLPLRVFLQEHKDRFILSGDSSFFPMALQAPARHKAHQTCKSTGKHYPPLIPRQNSLEGSLLPSIPQPMATPAAIPPPWFVPTGTK